MNKLPELGQQVIIFVDKDSYYIGYYKKNGWKRKPGFVTFKGFPITEEIYGWAPIPTRDQAIKITDEKET